MTVHSFTSSLRQSKSWTDAPWWGVVYQMAFPEFAGMVDVRKDGWAQRGGIDRVITLDSGKTILVDEKVRAKDWDDILLEYWSDQERRIPGWAAKPLACDFIAYAFVPSQTCYLLPALALRRAWREHGRSWCKTYGRVLARNEECGRCWTTVSTPVPISEIYLAINAALRVQWGQP